MKKFVSLVVPMLALLWTGTAFAQNSGVSGSVLDPSDALIPGVTVTATHLDTGVLSSTVTNETGTYNFVSLQPGPYRMSAALPGFQTQTFNNYRVGAGEQLRLNFTLQLAQGQTSIEVSVDATNLIATSSSSIGQVLSTTRVQSLPLIGEDILQLIDIMPGVVGESFAGVSQMSVNTVRDGLSVSDGRFNAGVFGTTVMNPDLVGEVRLILAPVDAELGRGNGQVQITTRSGTNRFTGSAVWNIRNTALNPNTWNNNRNIDAITGEWSPTQPNWENNHQYSVSYGGPIIRNKTFFFALWDQNLNYQRQLITASVMTDTARRGIYRYFPGWQNGNADQATNSTGGNPVRAVVDFQGNPLTPPTNPNGTAYTQGLRCFSVFGTVEIDGSPFDAADCPGGTAIISPNPSWDTLRPVFDSTGYIRRILDEMPQANYFATGDGLNRAGFRYMRGRQGNQGANVTIGNDLNANRWQINAKVDHNFSGNHKLNVGYTRERTSTFSDVPNWPDQIAFRTKRWPQVLTSNFTSTLSPNLLNEARFGIRYNDAGIDAPWEDQFGDQAVIDEARSWMIPGSNGYLALINAGAGAYAYGGAVNGVMNTNPGQYNGNKSKLFSYGDTLSWTRGTHAFKFGGEYRRDQSNGYNNSPAGGGVAILYPRVSGGAGGNTTPLANPVTQIPTFVANNRTDAANMLYFLAGSMNTASQTYWINSYDDVVNGTWHDTNDQSTGGRKFRPVARGEYSFFVKDDWKITRRLTLNLGVRYEFYGSPYISSEFTSTVADVGLGLFGVGRASGDIFSQWLRPGNLFLSGYGPNAAAADALKCTTGVATPNLPTSNCDPNNVTRIEFIGPGTPNPDKVAVREDRNNFGPAIGFAYNVPWFGEGKTTVRGGYQLTYGGSGRVVGGGGTTADETVIGLAPGSLSTPTTVLADLGGAYLDLNDIPTLVPVTPFSPALPGDQVPFHTRAGNFSAYDPNWTTPYVQNFTLSVNRSVTRNVNVDVQYIGTVSKKQSGSLNINTNNVFYNQELFDALAITRAGGNAPLLDQMLAGLNLNNGVTGYGPIGTVVNGVLQTGSAHIRRNTTFQGNLANGNFSGVAASLNGNGSSLPGQGTTGGLLTSPLTSVGGRLLRNGCDRIANGQLTTTTSAGVMPMRCFPENFITANPQIGNPTYITNTASSNYHSMQTQVTLRPTHGFSYQGTYTWSKNLATPGNGYTNPLDRNGDYTYAGGHRAHDFRSNGSFELPIGPNKLLLGNSGGWVARLIERWQMNLIFNMTSGQTADITASDMLYDDGVPDVVGPFDLRKGSVVWGGSATGTGQLTGDYFGVGNFVKVPDPQCAQTAIPDSMGFSIASSCSIDALADADGNILLQHPQPGTRGTLGRSRIELPGTWRFDGNMSKSFRISESKSLQVRFDATNVLNHPQPGNPTLDINSNTAFGRITTKTGGRSFQGQMRLTF